MLTEYILADFYPNGGKQQPGCPLRNVLTNLIGRCNKLPQSFEYQFPQFINRKRFVLLYFRKMFTRTCSSSVFGEFNNRIHGYSMSFIRRNYRESMHIQ